MQADWRYDPGTTRFWIVRNDVLHKGASLGPPTLGPRRIDEHIVPRFPFPLPEGPQRNLRDTFKSGRKEKTQVREKGCVVGF